MAFGYMSPGVGYTEEEVLPQVSGPETQSIGIVGGAVKGPLEMTLLTSSTQLNRLFGNASKDDFGVWAARKCLENSNSVYYQRILGPDAAKGSTAVTGGGPETEPFVFEAIDYDSTLEGVIISIEADDTTKVARYKAVKGTEELESISGFSVDPTSPNYILSLFNKRSSLFTIKAGVAIPDPYTGQTVTIRGSNDGIDSLTVTDVIGSGNKGMQAYKNPNNIDISTMITPGWTDNEIVVAAKDVCDYRGDIMFIPDCPQGLTPDKIIEWVEAKGDYDTRLPLELDFFAVYYPWVYDRWEDNTDVLTPPSAWVASQYAYSDALAGSWFAPAGVQDGAARGLLRGARGLEYEMTKEEQDLVYGTSVINPIVKFFGKGIAIWGNKTTKRTELYEPGSAMKSVNVRRMCNYIRKIVISISLTEVFNPNDSITWKSWKLKLTPRLRAIQEGRGLSNFRIQMDETTVTEEDINNGRMPGKIWIRPIRAVEWIPITFTVTNDSVFFTEDEEEVA